MRPRQKAGRIIIPKWARLELGESSSISKKIMLNSKASASGAAR
jgi:hypothetical protein